MIVGSALERISRPNVLRPNVPKCPRAQMSGFDKNKTLSYKHTKQSMNHVIKVILFCR